MNPKTPMTNDILLTGLDTLQSALKDLAEEIKTLRAVHSQRITDLTNKYDKLYQKCASDFSAIYSRLEKIENKVNNELFPKVNELSCYNQGEE